MSQSGFVHVAVERIVQETDKAFLCLIDGAQVWLPKSQIADADDYDAGDEDVTLSVTEWIAAQKGLEGE